MTCQDVFQPLQDGFEEEAPQYGGEEKQHLTSGFGSLMP